MGCCADRELKLENKNKPKNTKKRDLEMEPMEDTRLKEKNSETIES